MRIEPLKILITGANGQLASALSHHTLAKEFDLILCDKNQLDITDIASVSNAMLTHKPDIVVNTAAYTAVDKAEQDQELAFKVNCKGAENLAVVCHANDIPLIHISTDYIFDGQKGHAYGENDASHPINYYGESKWQGEVAVRANCEKHIILRVSSVFSEFGHNFYKTILRLANERKDLRVVSDQISCPTYAGDIAGAIFQIIKSEKKWSTYHFCSALPVSWHGFASAIVNAAKEKTDLMVEEVEAIPTSAYPTPAKRPAFSVLDCRKIMSDYQIEQPSWEDAIRKLL